LFTALNLLPSIATLACVSRPIAKQAMRFYTGWVIRDRSGAAEGPATSVNPRNRPSSVSGDACRDGPISDITPIITA
jgi:hypothetical protein